MLRISFISRLILVFSTSLTIGLFSGINFPYEDISLLPFDSDGWFGNQSQLLECCADHPISCAIEVGVWLGASARFLAQIVGKSGKVYCVDNWLGPVSPSALEVQNYYEQRMKLPKLYQQFLSNVVHAGLTDIIIPVRMESLEAAVGLKVMADLIYIDAGHTEEAVYCDIKAWSNHLNPGGIICGDDWRIDEVRIGVIKAAKEMNKGIYSDGNFWRLTNL